MKSSVSEKNISAFSKAQLGVFQAEKLREWVVSNSELLNSSKKELEMVSLTMSQLIVYSENNTKKISNWMNLPRLQ